jgi:chromate transport protein ChrA
MRKILPLVLFLLLIPTVKADFSDYPWLNLINVLVSPTWIVLLMIFGVSAAAEKMLNGKGIPFIVLTIILLIVFSFFTKTIPIWISIIFLILAFGYTLMRRRE